jgi:hypothetical protein
MQMKCFVYLQKMYPYTVEAIRKAFGRHQAKLENADSTSKVHGNRIMTEHHESLLIGYLMMRSEISYSEKVNGILHFSSFLLGYQMSRSTAYEIVNRNKQYLRPTKEKTMKTA